ncbi:MAG: DUF1254 domain-containing protein [Rhodoferax sp.]
MNMKTQRHRALRWALGALCVAAGPIHAQSSQPLPAHSPTTEAATAVLPAVAPGTNWREDFAYSMGLSAYLYGLPYGYFQSLRFKYPWVKPTAQANQRANQFWHQRDFTSAAEKDGGTPNTNLFYSVASFDVSKEPLILSVPAIKDRYYTHELISMDSDNFAYVGARATGTEAGNYAIVGPNWKGTLPADVKPLPPSRTPYGLIYGRTWVDGPNDLKAAYAIQDQYRLTPLSVWGKPGAKAPEVETPWAPYDPKADPLAEWKTINRALTENPPDARSAAQLGQFAKIGVGPGQDVGKLDEASQRGLVRAARDGRALIRKAFAQGMFKAVGSWNYPANTVGRAGLHDDYFLRAVTALVGNGINDVEESTYNVGFRDSEMQRLNSAQRYAIRFRPEEAPPVDPRGYWSLTAYGLDNNLIPNAANRYTVASKGVGKYVADADGSVTLYVQQTSPGADKEANWLPTPEGNRPFYLIWRSYLPGKALLEQSYRPPQIVRVP